MRHPSDDEIVARLLVSRGADENAFRVLVERYHHRVRRIASSVLNYHCATDIDEAVFDAFHALKQHFETNEGLTNLQGLLAKIAGCKALDQLRKRKRETQLLNAKGIDYQDALEPPMSPEDWMLAVEENVHREDRHHLVRHAVRQLPPSQRAVVELRHFGCCDTLKEVAQSLDITHEAVRQRYGGALRKLKQALGTPKNSVKGIAGRSLIHPAKGSEI